MSTEANKQLALKVYDALNAGDAAAIGDLVTSTYVEHDPLPGQGEGREGVIDRFSMIVNGLAPRFTVHDVIAEGDRVVVRATNHCVQDSFFGVPGRGVVQVFTATFTFRIVDGRIDRIWRNAADLQRLLQLGARILPPETP